ncbi:MAG TPA: hypothetical protein VFY21_07740, partial [Xanthobacteraceae bacterium]|nr:hypothetical protein [Xanthobacteraceae bacterium]
MSVVTRKVKDDEQGMRLDRWFKEHYPALPFGHLQKLLRTGQVRVDGGRAKTHTRLEPGQSVRVPPLNKSPSPQGEGGRDPGVSRGSGRVGRAERSHADLAPHPEPLRGSTLPQRGRDKTKTDAEFLNSITLYEDREVLVLNKPMGLAVQGGSGTVRHVDGLLE